MDRGHTLIADEKRSGAYGRPGISLLLASLGGLGGLLFALYGKILLDLGLEWYSNPDYSHGFLVPILSAYFVWECRQRLRALSVKPSIWGVGLLGVGLLMLLVGSIGAELYLQRASLMVVIAGLVLVLLGRDYLHALSFPIAFLFFMVPLPTLVTNAVTFPLQLFASEAAAFCLFKIGIPVLREGNLIMLPYTTLEVAEACSGIRSLQALLTLGTAYAYFTQPIMWKRWMLVILSVPIAIAANAFRVSATGVLAHYWGVELAEGFYHEFSGWLIFVVAFVLLVGCGTVVSKIGRGARSASSRISSQK
jgi:exosortase